MFCPKCNKWIPAITLFCPKCGHKVPDNFKKQGRIQLWVAIVNLILLAPILASCIFFKLNPNLSEETKAYVYPIVGTVVVLFLLCFAVLLAFQIIDLVKYMARHKIFAAVFCTLIVIAGGFSIYYFVINRTDNSFSNSLTLMQDNLTEIEAAKLMGDTAFEQGNATSATTTKIKIMSQLVAERITPISVPEELKDYKLAIMERGVAVAQAAQDTKTWKTLPAQARDFHIKLSDSDAEKLFIASTKKIAELKEFGDTAIKRNDKDAMRYIAAKLLVQAHWLNGIFHSSNTDTASLAYAYESKTREICAGAGGTSTGPITPGGKKGNVWCVQQVIQEANEIGVAAVNYSRGRNAGDKWGVAWQGAENISGAGLSLGEPPNSSGRSPAVQVFYDDCAAKGGIVGGAGIVKTGLPTTEFGYTCEYKYKSGTHGEQPCWDLLTYSGGRYMGGNEGCPLENVLPSVSDSEAQKTENKDSKWDGSYPVSTTVYCVSNIPGMPSAIPINITVTVSNNVGHDEGTTFAINNNGSGTEVSQYGRQGANFTVNEIVVVNYQFYMDGTTAKFNAIADVEGSALINNQVYGFSCYGSASSTRK